MADLQTTMINLVEEKKLWELLTSSPAWAKLVSTLQEQADELQRNIIYQPIGKMDEVFLQEFRKGQLEGRLSITVTAEAILSELDDDITRLKGQIDESGNTDDPSSGRGRHAAP